MWGVKALDYNKTVPFTRRSALFVDPDFQLRTSRNIIFLILISSLIVCGPVLFLINQNYQILRDLMYGAAPELLHHLEREQVFLNLFAVAAVLGQIVFVFAFSRQLTSRIAAPLKKIRQQIRRLSRGDMVTEPVRIREDDEFHELVGGFNYFTAHLREQQRKDLELIRRIRERTSDPRVLEWLDQLRSERDPSAPSGAVPGPRHAS
jgi:methyl-accepting chemotaxis protein